MNNETILNYINSKDIRNHLRTIDYQFTSLETAWLIYQCKNLTLAQKHEAWNNLISTMPDMPIDFRAFKCQSLHDFLKRHMDVDNRWIENFKTPGNFIYQFSATAVMYDCDIRFCDNDCVFSSFENCLNAAKKQMSDCDEEIKDRFKIKITKREIDNPEWQENVMELYLNHEFNILYVEHYGITPSKEDFDTHTAFEEMWFAFPTPFKKGDIIYDITKLNPSPMILEETAVDHFAKKGRAGNDAGDMSMWGYFRRQESNSIYFDNAWCYMDYEYYPPEQIKGKQRILLAVSNFFKGKIDIALCIKAYHQIMIEESAMALLPGEYTKEGLELAGLTEKRNTK